MSECQISFLILNVITMTETVRSSRLPGALGMYGLSLGIANIGETLPGPVYALLSGLNAAIVGVIALAAVQLSRKVISDQFTRALLFLGASAGLLYSALWYFPVLMFSAGVATIVWDNDWFNRQLKQILDSIRARFSSGELEGCTSLKWDALTPLYFPTQTLKVSQLHNERSFPLKILSI